MKLRPCGLFDFDITLTRGDSYLLFLRFILRRHHRAFFELLRLLPLLSLYAAGAISRENMKTNAQRLLRYVPVDRRQALVDEFCTKILPPTLRQGGLDRIRWHKDQGHALILASASTDFYLDRVSQDLGFDHLVCTKTTGISSSPSPAITGSNCRDEEKVRRLRALPLFAEVDWPQSWAYSDSTADLPILRLCGHPVAANPNRKLRRVARQSGFEIAKWP